MKPIVPIFLLFLFAFAGQAYSQIDQRFICPPCGCSVDNKKFDEVGKCPGCGMNLVGEIDPGEGYAYNNIYPSDVCELDPEEWLFLDVRTRGEFDGELGHLKGAMHIHVEDLEDRIDELSPYKDKKILVYCLVSIRSMRASDYLAEQGFSMVTNMLGGMDLWNDLTLQDLPCKESVRVIE